MGQLCNLHIRLKVQKPEGDSSVSGLTWDANCPGLGPYSQSPKGAEWVLGIGWKVNSVDPQDVKMKLHQPGQKRATATHLPFKF